MEDGGRPSERLQPYFHSLFLSRARGGKQLLTIFLSYLSTCYRLQFRELKIPKGRDGLFLIWMDRLNTTEILHFWVLGRKNKAIPFYPKKGLVPVIH